jgi:tetratricopeptide (TPR) repeat protein
VLNDQERFTEAIASFEDSIRAWPDRGGGHVSVAEARLHQGSEIPKALTSARLAVELDRKKSFFPSEVHSLRLAGDLGTLAWAVASDSGDLREVEHLLAEAFPLCGERWKTDLAKLHYHAACAYSTLRMADKSTYHLEQAIAVDPNGRFGRLARAAARR